MRSIRGGSAYIKNYRFSRYQNAITSSIPYRRTTLRYNKMEIASFNSIKLYFLIPFSAEELPIDGIGCFANAAFTWTRKYIISKESINRSPQDLITLPRPIYADSCTVNSKRYL